MATTTCPHGLPATECLICPTLAKGTAPSMTPAPAPAGSRVPARRFVGLHLAGVVVAVIVIGLVAWAVAGIVFALLHVLELAAVALAAGWVGYRVGHYRGRHPRS